MAEITIDTLPHWHDEPQLYDTLFLAGQKIAGVARVTISRKTKIDKKSAKGKNKAVVTKQGVEAAEVTIEIRLLSPEDFELFQDQWELFEPLEKWDPNSTGDALDIAHWAAKMRGVEAIIVESSDGPELKEGIMTVTVKAVEFSKPPAKTTGIGGGGALSFGTFVDEKDNVLPESRIASQGPGLSIKSPGGHALYQWTLRGRADGSSDGFYYVSGQFNGRFILEDTLLKGAWEAVQNLEQDKNKDVTQTPAKSKGAPELSDFDQPDETPDPTETDAGP